MQPEAADSEQCLPDIFNMYPHNNRGDSFASKTNTVDGRNPAPPGMYETLQVVG